MKRLLLLLLIAGFCSAITAQGLLQVEGKAIVNPDGDTVILRGMGLGGWMLQEGYMLQTASFANAQYQIRTKIEELIGAAETEAFYQAWRDNHVRKADIDSLKAWGFNSVRLPMHYNLFTLPIEDEPVEGQQTWLTEGFVRTDSLISWCKQNELYVILDMHATPGGQGYDQGISDYDPSKPSLFESTLNQEKLASLWRRLAERYVDEPWIAGYDLINEPNWNLPGGTLLRAIYQRVTDSIRTVDTDHIVFIEGNWFANDFTGLTPPWDAQIVYSPHKYWSLNDRGSIQWVLDLQAQHNTPLYLGESGENSNVWFRDAIKLVEDNGIGWAWWPMKKIDAIAGPLSVEKTPQYQTLLNYWNNGGSTPTTEFTQAALMDLTDKLRIENCRYQPDVIDAMFRQISSDESVPYKDRHAIPGVIPASDYDMGRNGHAYFDVQSATYHVSTGNYTAWNNGWSYRNDGVDIEPCQDNVNSNGFNVGWIEEGEWMEYQVEVQSAAVYDVYLRTATAGFEGAFHFMSKGADISGLKYVPNTGGYQSWQTLVLNDVVLTPDMESIRFYSDGRDYNLSNFEFIEVGPTTDLPTEFLSAFTVDEHTIQLNLNKPLTSPLPASTTDFEVVINGQFKAITAAELDPENPRIINFTLSHTISSDEVIRMNYNGNQIQAVDGVGLDVFTQEDVQNRLPVLHRIPTKMEAEDFAFQNGIRTETCYDTGGGKNIGNLDGGDYMEYDVRVPNRGLYMATFRTSAASETGEIKVITMDSEGVGTLIKTVDFAPTGDWQTWASTETLLTLPLGRYRLRLEVSQGAFNLNWVDFSLVTAIEDPISSSFTLYPNPGTGTVTVGAFWDHAQSAELRITNASGQLMQTQQVQVQQGEALVLNLENYPAGLYQISLLMEGGTWLSQRYLKKN